MEPARASNRPQPAARKAGDLYDARFRRLLGRDAWNGLPEAVQRRFSKRIEGARVAIYPGEITEARCSRIGRLFVQLARLIGGPLPLNFDSGVPAVVTVSEDHANGGQCWTRVYGRQIGFPQVIHSAKQFNGSTGLEEHIGCGIGMALRVEAVAGGLEFRSDHYFLQVRDHRIRMPRWLAPGETVVRHIECGDGRFTFSLQLTHRWLGELVYQQGQFRDG
ncbi:DUF4166 domain-containing protein [Parerythrobacter aestuarii]|uniref:DUF4166 domain-containing protein n=1 Tax=Parerythrobacter aestuarii TaxID=3020909 RepID=UPI0024DEB19B|nr:DUF4166 domain-containing protein [Parerythrobacter aestuarii]